MKRPQQFLSSLIPLLACAVLTLGVNTQAQDKKVDPAGNWTWTSPGRDGGPERKNTLKLKVEGDKVTGTLMSSGGQGSKGGTPAETPIADAKLSGDELSFTATRTFGDFKIVQKYTGKIAGDSFKGKVDSEINGKKASRDFEAKREAAK